jgi:hypothetical protein
MILQTCFPQAQTAGGSPWVSLKFFPPYFPAYNLYTKAAAARREKAVLVPPPQRHVRLILPSLPSRPEKEPREDMAMEVDEELEVSVAIT